MTTDTPSPVLPTPRARAAHPLPNTHGLVLALFHEYAKQNRNNRFAGFTPAHWLALVEATSFDNLVSIVKRHQYPQASARVLLGAYLYLAGTMADGRPLSYTEIADKIKVATGDTTLNRGHIQNLLKANRIMDHVTNALVASRPKGQPRKTATPALTNPPA